MPSSNTAAGRSTAAGCRRHHDRRHRQSQGAGRQPGSSQRDLLFGDGYLAILHSPQAGQRAKERPRNAAGRLTITGAAANPCQDSEQGVQDGRPARTVLGGHSPWTGRNFSRSIRPSRPFPRSRAAHAGVSPGQDRRFKPATAGWANRRRAVGLRRLLVWCFLAVPGQECRWGDGEDFGPAPAGMSRASAVNRTQSGRLVPDPVGVAAQYPFSCRSTSSSASFAPSLRNTRTAGSSIRRTSR
jgi:hypothetical protein